MTGRSKWLTVAAIGLATIACDRATKRVAARELAGEPRQSYFADTVRLEYVENRGAFLSLGANLPDRVRTALFTLGTLILLVGVAVVLARRTTTGLFMIGLSLLWAGGASNLVDRAARGRVIDFVNVGVGPLRTGIFNVADMGITLGVALVVVGAKTKPRNQRTAESSPEPTP